MKYCPAHVEDFLVPETVRFETEADEFHHYFQVICQCDSSLFLLLVGTKRSVHAICHRCLKDICLYDLSCYPAATKAEGEEVFQFAPRLIEAMEVFVGYEYGELDEGESFDQNDISWCQIFVGNCGSMEKIFDDETA